jgi:hypothetical protein
MTRISEWYSRSRELGEKNEIWVMQLLEGGFAVASWPDNWLYIVSDRKTPLIHRDPSFKGPRLVLPKQWNLVDVVVAIMNERRKQVKA